MGDGAYAPALPLFGGQIDLEGQPGHRRRHPRSSGSAAGDLEKYTHSYMHCWRHKTPIIYRAAAQWFAGMDDGSRFTGTRRPRRCARLRCDAIEATAFYPGLGQGAPARHDRQPAGLDAVAPAPAGACRCRSSSTGDRRAASAHARVARAGRAARRARGHRGLAVDSTPQELLGRRGAALRARSPDTLDVWFDSGSTHETVLRGSHAGRSAAFPADLYLEGSDQHRGWFHSSLLDVVRCSTAARPTTALLTHGFVRRRRGPQDVEVARQRHRAAEGLRHAGRRDPAPVGGRAPTTRASCRIVRRDPRSAWSRRYRRIRNTLRFLLANTADFDPARDALPPDEMLEIDRYALARRRAAAGATSRPTYERYEFHPIVAAPADLLLGGPGRLLPRHPQGPPLHERGRQPARRSAQTALRHLTDALLRLMAPILSFTAKEACRCSHRWPVREQGDDDVHRTWHRGRGAGRR
jgi:isoleucyl-tRNA synthetase